MVLDPRAIQIQVDGSCYCNPGGQSGCAAVVRYPEQLQLPDEQIVDYGCGESTNQRMELMPCIKALKWVRERQPWPDVTRVQIISDSTYVTNGISCATYWKRNKWRNRRGQPIFNDDLWDALLAARAKAGIRRVSTTLRQVLAKFNEFFICWVFHKEISRQDALGTTQARSVDPQHPRFCPSSSAFRFSKLDRCGFIWLLPQAAVPEWKPAC